MNQQQTEHARQLEEHIHQLEEHLAFLEKQMQELSVFHDHLSQLKKESGKEILSSIGKGVYIPAERKEGDLFVEVGAGIVLRKSASETQNVIKEQVGHLADSRMQLIQQIEQAYSALRELLEEIDKNQIVQ